MDFTQETPMLYEAERGDISLPWSATPCCRGACRRFASLTFLEGV